MVLLLLVNVTLLPENLASLNWRHKSSFSLMLASHLSRDGKPGAGSQESEVGVWVRVHNVQANSARQPAFFIPLFSAGLTAESFSILPPP